jgi:hypothetical protein
MSLLTCLSLPIRGDSNDCDRRAGIITRDTNSTQDWPKYSVLLKRR